jgi:group I intron endonuclease
MKICKALEKHDHSNFELTILEYCEPSKCLEREDYYFKLLNPEYNIAKDPTAAMSGRKHSDKSKQIMSDIAKKSENSGRYKPGENHSNYGKNLPNETKQKISDTNKKIDHSGRFKTGHSHSDETK